MLGFWRLDLRWKVVGVAAIVLLAVSIVLLIVLPGIFGGELSVISLTLTLVIAVTALLATLVLSSWILNCVGLSNPNEALGLPTGSVRAIIALALILIFAIMSVFMFLLLTEPQTTTTVTQQSFSNMTGGNSTFTNSTKIISGSSADMIDFSKQMLTTISTLVVAIAAFYFGTRSVQVAKGSKETADLFVDPSGEKYWVIGHDEPIIIIVKPTPEDAAFTWKISGDEYTSVSTLSPNRLKYTPAGKEPKQVTITFALPKYSDVEEKELKLNILSPALSIDPHGKKEAKLGKAITVKATPTPKDAKVVCIVDKDKPESVVEKKPNEFEYTPTVQGDVILTYKLSKYPEASKELKLNVKK